MSINASWAPANETSGDLWIEVSTMIGQTSLGGAAYGILTTLYILCLNALIPQLKIRPNRNWALFHIVYTTLLYGLVGVGTAGNTLLAQQFWINDRNYPDGGPLGLILNEASVARTVLVWDWIAFVLAALMQDAYVIYRCLVFWEWNYHVCALPMLCFIGLFPTSIALIVEIARPQEGLSSPIAIDFATAFYSFSVAINVLGTISIISRLIRKRKYITAVLGKEHSKVYTGVVAMLVESATAYSVVGLIFIGTFFTRNSLYRMVLPIVGELEGICPLMIIYRITIGRGWTNQTMRQISTALPTMQFNPPTGTKPPDLNVVNVNLSTVNFSSTFGTNGAGAFDSAFGRDVTGKEGNQAQHITSHAPLESCNSISTD